MQRVTDTKGVTGFTHRVRLLFGICLLAVAFNVHAERSRRDQGVSIPDTPADYVPGFTRVDANETGAQLSTTLDEKQAWQVLNESLSRLQATAAEKDQPALVTEWILWIYDKKSDSARSKPRSIFSTKRERHRFRFSVGRDATGQGSVIQVEDHSRQKEVDITPDSEYSWLEWQDRPPQPAAARTFLQRLQGDFEAAMSSQLVTASVSGMQTEPAVQAPPGESARIRPVTPTAAETVQPASTLVVQEVIPPAPASAPPATLAGSRSEPSVHVPQNVAAESKSVTSAHSSAAVPSATIAVAKSATPVVSSAPASMSAGVAASTGAMRLAAGDTAESTVAEPAGSAPSLQPDVEPAVVAGARPASLQPATATAAVTEQAGSSQAATAARIIQDGLLVDATPAAAWQALLRALKDLGIAEESSDQRQHMITTVWIDSFYDKKNQQFSVRSKEDEDWAFNWRGDGLQRHRFQLILLPVDAGSRSMIYAYHIGSREQIDTTPDSSQTLLEWVDREADPQVANAFLRRLRIVVIP